MKLTVIVSLLVSIFVYVCRSAAAMACIAGPVCALHLLGGLLCLHPRGFPRGERCWPLLPQPGRVLHHCHPLRSDWWLGTGEHESCIVLSVPFFYVCWLCSIHAQTYCAHVNKWCGECSWMVGFHDQLYSTPCVFNFLSATFNQDLVSLFQPVV